MVLETLFHLFVQYGLGGLFFSSFISSLFFIPAYASFLIPLYTTLKFNPYVILLVITTGSILGQAFNYYFGLFGSKHLIKYEKEIKKATTWLNRWGELSIFVVNFVPIFPADFVSVLVGFLRMDVRIFAISMSLGRLFQYALLIFGVHVLLKFLPFSIFI
jgi:membrane protein YqaA with SNARE-associated domain